ncbi:MAG: translation elongation factor-like protein [Terriglobia bacterium]
MVETEVGKVTHYFSRLGVAVVQIDRDGIAVGETVRIKGETTDMTQEVKSMQMEHREVDEAKAGDAVGLKVDEHVREKDHVYKVESDA